MAAVLSYRNFLQEGISSVIVLETDDAVGEVSDMFHRPLSKRYRWSSLHTPYRQLYCKIDLGTSREVSVIAIMGINMAPNDFTSDGFRTWVSYAFSSDGGYTYPDPVEIEVQDWGKTAMGVPMIAVAIEPTEQRLIELKIEWDSNEGPWMEAGRLWVGDGIWLPDGIERNWTDDVMDSGTLDQARGGATFEDPNIRTRLFQTTLGGLTYEQIYGFPQTHTGPMYNDKPCIQGLQHWAGATGEVVFIPDTSTPLMIRRTAIYGHMARVPQIKKVSGGFFDTSIAVQQEK